MAPLIIRGMFGLTRRQIAATLTLIVATFAILGPPLWRMLHPAPHAILFVRDIQESQRP